MDIPVLRQIQPIGITTQRRAIQIHIQEAMALRQKIIPLRHTVMVAVAQSTLVQKAVSITTAIAVEKFMCLNSKYFYIVVLLIFFQEKAVAAEKILTCKVVGYTLTSVTSREDLPPEVVTLKIIENKEATFIFISGSAFYSIAVTSASDARVIGKDMSTKNAYSIYTHSKDTNSNYEIKLDRVTGLLAAKNSSGENNPNSALISFSGQCSQAKNQRRF